MSDKPAAGDALEAAPTSAPEKINKPAAPRKRKPAKPKRKAPAKRKPAAKSTAVVAKDAGGRPPYEPTPENGAKVRMLAGVGLPVADIGRWIGLGETTLRKYHGDDLLAGQAQANAKVATSLFTAATNKAKPNVTAMIFWLKARAGWKEDPARPLLPPPLPEAPKPEAPGKKEAANVAALTAEIGSDWESILGTPGPVGLQ